ncbi:MAG: SdrD B-like domain-containing protein [Anaerolineae bacterium]
MRKSNLAMATTLAMLVNLFGASLAPLPAAAAPPPARDLASVGVLPSWYVGVSPVKNQVETILPRWFATGNRQPASSIEPQKSSLLPVWFSPSGQSTGPLTSQPASGDQHPASSSHHTIHSDDVTISGPDEINNCDVVTFTIVATNDPVTTTNVIITSTMPTGFTPALRVFDVGTVGPNETITRTAVFNTSCDAVSGQNTVTLTQSGAAPVVRRTEFTLLPGAITLRKQPSVIPAAVGDVVTWTVLVENTGYGRVDNVVVTDTLGTGLTFVAGDLSASYSSLAVGEVQSFIVSARVDSCTGLDNDVEATWGCPGQVCQSHTAQASIDLQLSAPYLDYTLPTFEVDYCTGSGVFTIPVVNSGAGTAHDVVLDTNMGPFSVTALSPGAVYTPGIGFTLPDITGTSDYDLICELTVDDPCGLETQGGNFEFELHFDDDCGNPYVLPAKQESWSLGGAVPSLSISKDMPGEIYLGEIVSPTIEVEAANLNSPLVVTDTLPPGWTVMDPDGGNVFTITGQLYITWTVPGTATTNLNPVLRSPVTDTMGNCAYCGTQAQNTVEVRATDCWDCELADSDTASTYIQCEDFLSSHDKQVAPAAAETCTGFTYTSTYVFASSFNNTPTWDGMIFTDTLDYQTYVPGSAGISLQDGVQSCTAVFSQTVSNGLLVLTNISPTCAITVPGTTMVINFNTAITAPAGCDDLTFYDWSYLDLGVTGNGVCGDDGILEEGVFVTADAPQMTLGIDGIPTNVEPCAEYPITLTLTRVGDAPANDVALRFDTVDYAVVELLGFGGATPYFTHTDALSYTWFYSDDFATATTGTVYLRVQRHCDATGGAVAGAWYEGNCEDDDEYFEECHVSAGANPPPLHPSLIVAKYPELYYADGDIVTWTLTLINSGPATAHDIVLTDTLGSGLRYYTSTITTTRGSVAGVVPEVTGGRWVTWTLEDVPSGTQVTIKLVAEIVDCDGLTNEFSGWQSCQGQTCLHEGPESSYVILPTTVLINTNNALSPLHTCLTRTITATVRNAGLMSVYSTTITENLPPGMLYVPGSTEYAVGTSSTPPVTGWVSGGEPAGAPYGPLAWGSSQITNLARLYPHETVWVRFDVRADCDFDGGNITIQASYEDVCGDPQSSSASHFAMGAEPPQVTASKEGHNLTAASAWGDPTYAEPGDVVQWRITVDNSGGSGAPLTVVTDTLPANTTYVTADPLPTSQSGRQVVWDVGTLAAHTAQVFTVTGVVNAGGCTGTETTNVVTATWGCPDPACRRETMDAARLRTQPELANLNVPARAINLCEGTLRYVFNIAGLPAYNVRITDTLPAGLVYSETVSISGPYTGVVYPTPGVSNPTWVFTAAGPGQVTVDFRVQNGGSGACDSWSGSHNVEMTYEDSCGNPLSGSQSGNITRQSPQLTVEKTPAEQTADAGDVVTWTITVRNTGSGEAPNVLVTDEVGSGFDDSRVITWPVGTLASGGGTWSTQVTATVAATGAHFNVVTATGTCGGGCNYATATDDAHVTLLTDFAKEPDTQTGTIGSVVTFTFASFLSGPDAVYENLTLTDTLPAGLGYVSSWLSATYDSDGSQGGSGNIISATPTVTPGWLASGDIVWRLGDLSGTVRLSGVITAMIRDIPTNLDGVRRTNTLRMTYTDDGQPYAYTDTADVDILEPLLHLYKDYITPHGCRALRFLDNFNDDNAAGWTTTGGTWSVSNGVYRQTANTGSGGPGYVGVFAYTGDTGWRDYSLDLMMRSTDNDLFGVIFRHQSDDTYYRFAWGEDYGGTGRRLERFNGGAPTTLASDATPYRRGRWYHVEVRVEGAWIRVYVDGALLFDVVDSAPLLSGNVALYNNYNAGTYFDDISVDRLEEEACTVGAGDLVTYTLTISNQARLPGYDLVVTDVIPAGMSLVTYTLESDDPASSVTAAPSPGDTGALVWNVDQLTATSPFDPRNHTALTLTVVLAVSDLITANTVLPNRASLAYDNWEDDGDVEGNRYGINIERDYSGGSHSAAVRTVDGGIVKAVTPPTATLGDLVTYIIRLPEPPITATLYSVVVSDEVDGRLLLRGVDGPGGSVTTAGNTFTVTYPSIPHGEQRAITVTTVLSDPLGAVAGDAITNVTTLSHTAGLTVSNRPVFTVTEPALSIIKASDPPTSNTVSTNESVTYTVRITNGSGATVSAAYDVAFTDTLPVGMQDGTPALVVVTLDGAPVPPGDYAYGYSAGVLTVTFTSAFSIPVGGVLLIRYVATVDADVGAGLHLTNRAEVTWSSLPGDVDGDRDYGPVNATTTVHTPLATGLTKGVTPPTVTIGSRVIFTVTLPAPRVGAVLNNVVFTDVVDSRLQIDGVSPKASYSGQVVTAYFSTIPTYTQEIVVITATVRDLVTVTNGTQITNVAALDYTANPSDTIPSNVVTVTVILGRIGDYVWVDLDRDGVQDAGETPIPGVIVDLYDSASGAYLGSDTTNGSGLYLFDDLPLNVTYTVQLSQVNFAPTGPLYPYTHTLYLGGAPFDNSDSNATPNALFGGLGYAVTTTLTSAITQDLSLDFGFYAAPGLEIVKTVAPGAAVRHMPFTYTIRINNTGRVTFTTIALTDTLPADFYYVRGSGVPTNPDTIAEPLLVWNDLVPQVGLLPPGESVTVTFAVTATPGITGTYWNMATVTVTTTPGDVLTDTDDVYVDIRGPEVEINKIVAGIDRDEVQPNYVTFTIVITNVGPSVIDRLPLLDQYDPYYLSFHSATPYPEQDNDDGSLTWNDLTGPAPHGFGRNLPPGESLRITTVFRVAHDINVTTTNIATTTNVVDAYDNPANDDDEEEDIGGEGEDGIPTPVEVRYFRAVAEESAVRLEWATAAELGIVGFHVYRAPSGSLSDAQTIGYFPATGSDSAYSYLDRDVTVGRTYWYWLVEEVGFGDPDTYGPVQGGFGVDSLPYRLYLPLVLSACPERS